jgi:DNA anti-recombination protein RmuC
MLNLPTWDDIIGTMRSEKRRQYKIDVETDSTVAGTLSSDMAGLSQVLTAISQAMQELAPMVEQGVLPVDAAKEIILTVIRRARMGMAVEDAFDKLQAPKPKPDPAAAKAQAEGQADIAKAQAKAQSDAQLEQMRQQGENQRLMLEEHAKTVREQFIEQMKSQREENDARFDAMVKIIVATIGATKQADQAVQPVADRTVAGSSALPSATPPAQPGVQ